MLRQCAKHEPRPSARAPSLSEPSLRSLTPNCTCVLVWLISIENVNLVNSRLVILYTIEQARTYCMIKYLHCTCIVSFDHQDMQLGSKAHTNNNNNK